MEIQPFGDRVLLELVPEEEKTESGIYIPDTNSIKQCKGIVRGIGEGTEETEKIMATLNKDDVVIFNKGAGTTIKDGKVTYIVLSVRDIIGIIK